MLLYDVTYSETNETDSLVTWGYLKKIAKNKKNEGATAICKNWGSEIYKLKNGEWVSACPQSKFE